MDFINEKASPVTVNDVLAQAGLENKINKYFNWNISKLTAKDLLAYLLA